MTPGIYVSKDKVSQNVPEWEYMSLKTKFPRVSLNDNCIYTKKSVPELKWNTLNFMLLFHYFVYLIAL